MESQHIVTIIVAVVASSGFWNLLNLYIDKHHKKRTRLEEAMMCVLHDRVYFLCRQYIGKPSIAHDDYDNLNKLFSAYTDLGGNGTAKKLMGEVEKIPISEE